MKKKSPVFPWIFLYKLISFFFLVFFLGLNLQASPLLNVNIEESDEYDYFLGSIYASSHSTTIRPFSYVKLLPFVENINRLYLNLDNFTDVGYYWKPIKSIRIDTLYSQEKYFMPGASGLDYQDKANVFIFEDGFISLKNYFVLYYQFKQSFNVDTNVNQGELFRAYVKMLVKKVSLEAGIDNVALGPGEYGLILSNNTKPYPLVKLQSEDFFKFFGKLDFLLMHGWLDEGRDDYSKPKLIVGKLAWKPVNSIELGLTRLVFYGNELRDSYAIQDYPYLFYGLKDNNPGEKYNNLSFLSGDLSLIFPLNEIWSSFRIFKIYSEYAVNKTHILSSNQSNLPNDTGGNYEQKNEFALLSGILLSTENSIFRFEYVSISKYFYYHLNYQSQGFSYNGFSLGYPYGYNMQSVLFKYKYYISDDFFVESQFGGYQIPLFDPAEEGSYSITQKEYTDLVGFSSNFDNKIRRYFILISSKVYLKPFIIGLQFRVDKSYNYTNESMELFKNANNEKLIFIENKTLYFFNLSVSCQI